MYKPYLPPERVTVISIVPKRIVDTTPVHGPYVADAAPAVKGEALPNGKQYSTFHHMAEPDSDSIGAAYQNVDTMINDERAEFTPLPIPADAIAEDLARRWSVQAYLAQHDARPGVLVLPVGRSEPTEEELEELFEMQERYAQEIVLEGREFEKKGEIKKLSPNHHMWAEWLGLGKDAFSKAASVAPQADAGVLASMMQMMAQAQAQLAKQQELIEELSKKNVAAQSAALPPPIAAKGK